MPSYNARFVCLVALAGALVSLTEAANQKCYVCDSTMNPLGCTQSVFSPIAVKQDTGCLCCTKSNKNNVVTRACPKDNALDCFPLVDRSVCLTDLCNSAPPNRVTISLIGQAFLFGAALFIMFR